MKICECCGQLIEKTCEQCGTAFYPDRMDQRFCTHACRQKHHRIMRAIGIENDEPAEAP